MLKEPRQLIIPVSDMPSNHRIHDLWNVTYTNSSKVTQADRHPSFHMAEIIGPNVRKVQLKGRIRRGSLADRAYLILLSSSRDFTLAVRDRYRRSEAKSPCTALILSWPQPRNRVRVAPRFLDFPKPLQGPPSP